MRKTHTKRGAWIAVALIALVTAAGLGLCQIQPSGRKAGLIQFDVISELNMLSLGWPGHPNRVVFARYWVCEDYYAVAVAWTEPYDFMKTLIIFSDKTGFRMDDETRREDVRVNTTYPKPLGERGPFPATSVLGSTSSFIAKTRFAEVEAVAKRVYVSDLGPPRSQKPGATGVIGVDVPEGTGGITRQLARLKVRARDNRIESMELLDNQQRQLGRMRYEYEPGGNIPRLTKLIADWPPRPVKLAIDVDDSGPPQSATDYISHKGGRTSTVTYRNVTVGDRVLRLPVQVEVYRSDDKRLLRSAKLMNFRYVDLDKAGVWQVAKAFAGSSSEDQALARLVKKYLEKPPRQRKPLLVDPNDVALARGLIAKYPVPDVSRPSRPGREARMKRVAPGIDPNVGAQQRQTRTEGGRREFAQRREDIRASGEQAAEMPAPKQMMVEPGDARAIREWIARYGDMLLPPPLGEPEKARPDSQGPVHRTPNPTQDEQEIKELHGKLRGILDYHRIPQMAEDRSKAVEPNELDLKQIRQLQRHYEELAMQQDRGLGGQLKALGASTQLDWMLRDYDAFEGHTVHYLQMVRDAGLVPMHMVGGFEHIRHLVKAGQYDKANRLIQPWADRSAAENDADAIFRFANMEGYGPVLSWASLQLLDRLLKRPGLSPVQRYEALALRAVNLDEIDGFLADPEAGNSRKLVTDREADRSESRV